MERHDLLETAGEALEGTAPAGDMGKTAPAAEEGKKHRYHKNSYLVDAFSHVVPLEFLSLLEKLWPIPEHPQRALNSQVVPLHDLAARVSLMETTHVDMNILVPGGMLEFAPPVWADETKAVHAAQFLNNFLSDNWVSAYPGKFKAVALLPSVTASAMVTELERAVTQKGCVGGLIGTGPANKPLDHADYMGPGGLYEKAVQLNVPLWVHPVRSVMVPDYTFPGEPVPSPYYISQVIGWPYDSSVAMYRLIFSGVFDRYPDLKIIIHHQGALFPTWWDRIQGMLQMLEDTHSPGLPTISKPWIDHARKFYVDTANPDVRPDILGLTYKFFGPDHVLFGTDTPMDINFVPIALETIQGMNLSSQAEKKIFSGNILKLIG